MYGPCFVKIPNHGQQQITAVHHSAFDGESQGNQNKRTILVSVLSGQIAGN